MTDLKEILAHHAGARIYQQVTGRYPSPEELARFLQAGDGLALEELEAYGSQGSLSVARSVLADPSGLVQDLGQVYQRLRETREKKGLGQVFTPGPAVNAAFALLGNIKPARIIDPACGAGEFLLHAARRWPRAELTGVDIDPMALAVARTRLRLAGAKDVRLIPGNALNLQLPRKYDLVMGNPPWGCTLSPSDVQGFAKGRLLNSFVYFLELAARLLEPGRHLTVIVPEAFIKVWTYWGARDKLLRDFALCGLHYIPHLFTEYYAPAMLMAAVRRPAEVPEHVPVWYQYGLKRDKLRYNTLSQQAIRVERFNINWHPGLEALWSKCCQGAVFLKEANLGDPLPRGEAIVDFSLGVVTGSNQRFVSPRRLTPRHLPVLSAEDVTAFAVAPASRWLEYDREELQQAAPLEKYQVPAKIVYRFIAREICAAADFSGSLTLNSLNIIIPLSLPFPLEYLVALLNSKLLNTLYMYHFFTGKVLTRNIKQLPLRVGTGEDQERAAALARELARGQGNKDCLDAVVFRLYGLSSAEVSLVSEQHVKLKKVFFV